MVEVQETICRICMEQRENIIFIFTMSEDNTKTLAEMLTECNKYQVNENDKLSKYICEKCSSDVRNAYFFKETVEQSYERQMKLLNEKLDMEFQNANQYSLEKSTQTESIGDLKLLNVDKRKSNRQAETKEVACPICHRMFSRKDHTKEHIIKVHKEDPLKYFKNFRGLKLDKFECPICKRKFNRKQHLMRHLSLVHKEDPKSVLMQAKQTPDSIEEEVTMNEGNESRNEYCMEKNPISSDSETERASVDLSANEYIDGVVKLEPSDKIEDFKEESVTQMIVKVESTHFYPLETDDNDNEDNYFEFPNHNIQIEGNAQSDHNSSDNDSEPLIQLKNSTVQRSYGSGEGTPEERTCPLCKRVFSRLCHLRRHVQTVHTQDKPHSCLHCGKCFARSDRLKNHIQGVHSGKSHKCDMCDKAFSRKEALQRHKKTPHNVATNLSFDCTLCERTFSQKRFLVRHQLLHSERIFACSFCEETFKDRKLFYEHERSHKSNKKDFLCSICGESFGRIDYLRIHVQRHLGDKPHKCQYCEKSFIRKSDLKEHERYHTNTRPNVCKICGKAFVRRSKLTIHMRIHTGEKPYKCDHCPKSFAQSNDLKAHVRRHTGERYKCQECEASFLQLYGLRQHALNVHGTLIESSTGRLEKIDVPVPM